MAKELLNGLAGDYEYDPTAERDEQGRKQRWEGAFARVYAGVCTRGAKQGKHVVLRFLRTDLLEDDYLREARGALFAGIWSKYAWTPEIYDYESVKPVEDARGATRPGAIISELWSRETLDDWVDQMRTGMRRPLSFQEVRRLLGRLCECMRDLHVQEQWLLRDLSFRNVLVRRIQTGLPDIRVIDFGLACPIEEVRGRSVQGQPHGSLVTKAPELFAGASPNTPQGDVYSAGTICWSLLRGDFAFEHGNNRDQEHEPISSWWREDERGELNEALADLIAAMVAVDPRARPNAEQALATLEELGSSGAARHRGALQTALRWVLAPIVGGALLGGLLRLLAGS